MPRIKADILNQTVEKLFFNEGVSEENSKLMADIITESSIDGYQSHGINRVPVIIEYIRKGVINLEAELIQVGGDSVYKMYDGNDGLGPINAWKCTDEAINIAERNGIGLIALKNNTHWLRAGTYGWKAVEEGMIFICWTNTIPNLPPYGFKKNLIGNNPFVIAVPHKSGNLVLDMALSQFSYGKVASYARRNKELPVIGGYDENNNLTKNARSIREKGRHLPIGFWKGSALSLILDLVAAVLSGGKTTMQIGERSVDAGLSQIFLAIDPGKFGDKKFQENLISETLKSLKAEIVSEQKEFYYPGKGTLIRRKENLENGIPVESEIWEKVLSLFA